MFLKVTVPQINKQVLVFIKLWDKFRVKYQNYVKINDTEKSEFQEK